MDARNRDLLLEKLRKVHAPGGRPDLPLEIEAVALD
jgi:hypothetical protein